MSRKVKPPPAKPSKAYLVSFGDTMTALLAFFIVLNSFAKDQTGANMHSGTGSFVNAVSSIGLPGQRPGKRSQLVVTKTAPAPLYAVSDPNEDRESRNRLGPDSDVDQKRVIDRQSDNFKRFLSEMNRQHTVEEQLPTRSQIVLDSFENLAKHKGEDLTKPLKQNAIQIASEAIGQLTRDDFELEIVVWATMPSRNAMKSSMETAMAIQKQIDRSFSLSPAQRSRMSTSAKPWLFVDTTRPRVSFILSRMDTR